MVAATATAPKSRNSQQSSGRYQPDAQFLDELFDERSNPRPQARALLDAIAKLGQDGLLDAGKRRDALFMAQAITFNSVGAVGAGRERPFPLDLIPRIIGEHEWVPIKRGLAQRITALNAFLNDIYSDRRIIAEGILPAELAFSCPQFMRSVHGIRPPLGIYAHMAGCDLVRDRDGSWCVLEDNVRVPSGISYVLENRAAMARLVPELFAPYRVRPVDHYPQLLLGALRALAPGMESNPTIVVWTPGPANSAYFEHAYLARQMGVELVEASDLAVRDDMLHLRTTKGLERAHVIYRRLDDDFIDPLELRPDSLLGVPGLIRAYRAGNLAIANAPGTGVADDKAVYRYVPEMIRFYLGEEPLLRNVRTYLLSDREQREHLLANPERYVFKPTGESGGRGVLIGRYASEAQLAKLSEQLASAPERWIAQDLIRISTLPAVAANGTLAPRHADLRPFAVFGEQVEIVPGGLTRVALDEGSLVVNSSRGGGSKDTWVLASQQGRPQEHPRAQMESAPALPHLRFGGWSGQEQQQSSGHH